MWSTLSGIQRLLSDRIFLGLRGYSATSWSRSSPETFRRCRFWATQVCCMSSLMHTFRDTSDFFKLLTCANQNQVTSNNVFLSTSSNSNQRAVFLVFLTFVSCIWKCGLWNSSSGFMVELVRYAESQANFLNLKCRTCILIWSQMISMYIKIWEAQT